MYSGFFRFILSFHWEILGTLSRTQYGSELASKTLVNTKKAKRMNTIPFVSESQPVFVVVLGFLVLLYFELLSGFTQNNWKFLWSNAYVSGNAGFNEGKNDSFQPHLQVISWS